MYSLLQYKTYMCNVPAYTCVYNCQMNDSYGHTVSPVDLAYRQVVVLDVVELVVLGLAVVETVECHTQQRGQHNHQDQERRCQCNPHFFLAL